MREDRLSEKSNGSWSLAMAELNKTLFFKAYASRIDEVAERRALKEAEAWLNQVEDPSLYPSSKLLQKWIANPPKTEADWKWWIAVHQRHLFVPHTVRGAFYQVFPAWKAIDRVPDYQLTAYFYEALRKRAK